MSIIAEALKKAQEKRTQTAENIDSRLEKILSGEETLIPENFKRNLSLSTPPVIYKNKKDLSIREKPLGFLFLASVIFLVSAAIFLPSYFSNRSGSEKTEKTSSTSDHDSTPLLETPIENTREVVLPEKIVKNAETGTSAQEKVYFPSPLSAPKITPVLPSLNGIMYTTDHPQAIINGVLSSEGDIVDNSLVIKILPDRVFILSGEKEYEIKII